MEAERTRENYDCQHKDGRRECADGGGAGNGHGTHVNEAGRSQEEMVLFELLGMDDAEVATDADALCLADVCTFELLVLFLGEVGHGAFELGDDRAWDKGTCGENT